jgi:hypothetical protein
LTRCGLFPDRSAPCGEVGARSPRPAEPYKARAKPRPAGNSAVFPEGRPLWPEAWARDRPLANKWAPKSYSYRLIATKLPHQALLRDAGDQRAVPRTQKFPRAPRAATSGAISATLTCGVATLTIVADL